MEAQWERLLVNRGLLGEAQMAGWRPGAFGGEIGWLYPVYNAQGLPVAQRFKNFNSKPAKFKYAWPDGQPDGVRYYLFPDTLAAIDAACGGVILSSGEPDTLAYRSAGAKNVLNWFGEKAVPLGLATDLRAFGVTSVECYPDRDEAGTAWAQGIANALLDSGISCRTYQLPGAIGSKADINALWMACNFDVDCFWSALSAAPQLDLKPEKWLKPSLLPLLEGKDSEELPADYYAAIERALGVIGYKSNGFSEPVRCPFHGDEHASAGWHHDKHILHCFVCNGEGEHFLAKEVAEKLSIRWQEYVKPRVAPRPMTILPAAPRPAPAGQPSVIKSWEEATDKLLAELDGNVPLFEPLPMPFKNLRLFGGFAKRMSPGKMIAIVGDSGTGKTSLIETMVDAWRRAGFHGVFWGAEWDAPSYVQRAVQRMGGPSFERVEDHKAFLSEVKRNVPVKHRTGEALADWELKLLRDKAEEIRAWSGKMNFVEKMNLLIEGVVKHMGEVAALYAASGKRLSFAVLDYAQLVTAQGESETARLNHILNAFKTFCVDRQIVGLVGSQMGKADGRAAAGGAKGNLHSLVTARSDAFNLALVLTRQVDEAGVATPLANIRIVKNSLGRLGDTQLLLKPEKMAWFDVDRQLVDVS